MAVDHQQQKFLVSQNGRRFPILYEKVKKDAMGKNNA
jgi:hypothetical protein